MALISLPFFCCFCAVVVVVFVVGCCSAGLIVVPVTLVVTGPADVADWAVVRVVATVGTTSAKTTASGNRFWQAALNLSSCSAGEPAKKPDLSNRNILVVI